MCTASVYVVGWPPDHHRRSPVSLQSPLILRGFVPGAPGADRRHPYSRIFFSDLTESCHCHIAGMLLRLLHSWSSMGTAEGPQGPGAGNGTYTLYLLWTPGVLCR